MTIFHLAGLGADDGVALPPPSPGARFASLRDVVVIQGVGHFPHRERPAETAEAILAVLGDLRGSYSDAAVMVAHRQSLWARSVVSAEDGLVAASYGGAGP